MRRPASTAAKMKLFQLKMKDRIVATVMPGKASGIDTRRNVWNRLAPSMRAASSRSTGRPSKCPIITQTTIGTVITRWLMMIGVSVPVMPSSWNSRNSGIR